MKLIFAYILLFPTPLGHFNFPSFFFLAVMHSKLNFKHFPKDSNNLKTQ